MNNNHKVSVSVIVLTYNPDLTKTLKTISMIIKQKECEFELIVADDGSKENHFVEIEEYLKKEKFHNYNLIGDNSNVGTVRNCLNAVLQAKGKYVFCTSPGDYLHDEKVLHDFYKFSEKKNAAAVFGNAVFYNCEGNDGAQLVSIKYMPKWPELYNVSSFSLKETAFFVGNYLVGATIFRNRKIFEKYLRMILGSCKYVEDNTTIAYMLIEHELVLYYDRNIVFYEYGGGISTNAESKWDKIIQNELKTCYEHISNKYPRSKLIKAAVKPFKMPDASKNKKLLVSFSKCPFMAMIWLLMIIHRHKPTSSSPAELKRLKRIINSD